MKQLIVRLGAVLAIVSMALSPAAPTLAKKGATSTPTATVQPTEPPVTEAPTTVPTQSTEPAVATATPESPTAADTTVTPADSSQAAPQYTLTLSSNPDFLTKGGKVSLNWELTKPQPADQLLTLKFYLPEGFELQNQKDDWTFDVDSHILTIQTADTEGTIHLNATDVTTDSLIGAEVLNGEALLARTSLILPLHEQFDVKQNGGSFSARDGKIKITVPDGALEEDTLIEVKLPTDEANLNGSKSGYPFELDAKGKDSDQNFHQFNADIEIQVDYSDMELTKDQVNQLYIYWHNPETGDWEALPSTVDPAQKTVSAYVNHFSVFDVGVNNWQATRLPTVDAFQVSNFTGAGTFSLPIEVPAGPGGLKPDLTLSYSSQVVDNSDKDKQSSWVGMGWSLDPGSVTPGENGGPYFISVNGVSSAIRPWGGVWSLQDENFWKVVDLQTFKDKEGNTYYFNHIATAYALNYDTNNVEAFTYGYYLTQVKNVDGQTIDYTYTDQTKMVSGHTSVTNVFLSTITYGGYRVRFLRGPRADYTAAWDTDAAYHIFGKDRLKQIVVETTGGQLIRRYDLTYNDEVGSPTTNIWSNVVYSAGGKVSTLRSVQEIGSDGTSTLPAYTFSYDGLHLTDASNGQGGSVQYTYDTTPYSGTYRPSYNWFNSFCRQWGTGGWTGGSITTSYEIFVNDDGTKYKEWYCTLNGRVTTTQYETKPFRPGGVYTVQDLTAYWVTNVVDFYVGINDGNSDILSPPDTSSRNITLPVTATKLDPVMKSVGGGTDIGNFMLQLRTSAYRVKTKTISDGNNHSYTTSYTYTGPLLGGEKYCDQHDPPHCIENAEPNSQFWGHASVRENRPDGTVVVTAYNQDDILRGRPISVTTYNSSADFTANKPAAQTLYTYASTAMLVNLCGTCGYTYGYGHYWVRTTSQEDRIYNSTGAYTATKTDFGYETTYGNMISKTESQWNGSSWNAYRTTTIDYSPANTTSLYLVDLPARQQVKDAGGTLLAETQYLYDSNTAYNQAPTAGKLIYTRTWVSGTNYSQVKYGYDAYGNRTTVTTYQGYYIGSGTPTGARSVFTCYGSGVALAGIDCPDDGYHSYPLWIRNQKSQKTDVVYDYVLGVPLSETDPNNATTTAEYDSFGRITNLYRPDPVSGQVETNATLHVEYVDSYPFTTTITLNPMNYSVTRVYDGMGRQTSITSGGVTTDTIYQSATVTKQSTPYTGASPDGYTVTTLDPSARTTTVTAPDNTSVVTLTNGLTTTVTDANNHSTTTTKDVWGRVANVTPPTGPAVAYTYDTMGNLLTASRGGATTTLVYNNAGQKTSMTDADMGSWSYTYDALGNLKSQTDTGGCVTGMNYDSLDRMTMKYFTNCPTTTNVTYVYDGGTSQIGHRTSMTDGSGSTTWTYDARGRMAGEQKTILGSTYNTSYHYNSADLMDFMTYPDNEVVNYHYNSRMLLDSVMSLSGTYAQSITYDDAGRMKHLYRGSNILDTAYNYNTWDIQGGRLQSIVTTQNGNSTPLQNLAYTYDSVGNVKTITDGANLNQKQCFNYDALDRLTLATTYTSSPDCTTQLGNGNYAEGYGYDATTGNLSAKGGLTLAYGDSNHKHAVTSAGGNTYTYDANGNQITRVIGADTFNLSYDAENRLVSVSKNSASIASFVYDGDGNQVQATISGTTTTYVNQFYEVTGSSVTKYYFAGATRLAMRKDGTLSFMLGDHLGSSSVVTDASGNVPSYINYTAWGEIRYPTSGSLPTDRLFTGQRGVASIGLMFYNARWYDPQLGRFAQADSIVPAGVQGYDRYAYVNNSPVNFTDPTGHCSDSGDDWCFKPWHKRDKVYEDNVDSGLQILHGPQPPSAYKTPGRKPGQPRCVASYCENLEWFLSSLSTVLDGIALAVSINEAIDATIAYAAAAATCIGTEGAGCGPAIASAYSSDKIIAASYGILENTIGLVSTGLTAYNDWLQGNTGVDDNIGFYIGKDTVVSARNTAIGYYPESYIDLGISASQIIYDVQRMSGAKSGGYLRANEIKPEVITGDWYWK